MNRSLPFVRYALLCLLGLLLFTGGCKRGFKQVRGEAAFVTAPQVNLRDRLSAIYNKAGVVKNGERVEVLEKNKRFVRVRSPRGEEGWMESRLLVGPEVADAFAKLAQEGANLPAQGRGAARAELNMHSTPGRDTDHLYRLDDGTKVEILKRSLAQKLPPGKPAPNALPKATGGVTIAKPGAAKPNSGAAKDPATEAPAMEDWLLVRDAQKHVGWVLARMVDAEIPMEIAQYAEGQRIMATFVLCQVTDVGEDQQTRQVPQYLVALNEPKDGMPWDYNQIRVFSWNSRRHRYETAYRERNLYGVFPISVGHQVFEKEGDLPTFTLRVKDEGSDAVREKRYRFAQPMVRRVLTPEEQRTEDALKAQHKAEVHREHPVPVKGKKKRR